MGAKQREVRANLPGVPATVTATISQASRYAWGALRRAETQQIKTNADYEDAGVVLLEAKKRLKELEGIEKSVVKPITAGLKAFRALIAQPKEVLTSIVNIIDVKQAGYRSQLERQSADAQRTAEKEADALNKKTLRQAESKAARLEAAGKTDEAESVRATAQSALVEAAPVQGFEPPKVEGLTTRTTWAFEVTDPSLVPDEYWQLDLVKIGEVVREQKAETSIPGVRAFPKESSVLTPGAAAKTE